MRNKFDEQLEELNIELIKMGALCEDAIAASIKCLLDDDDSMGSKALEADEEIDRKEREIEGLCMKLLLQQQPVARDLRVISSALKMISDMERIGDQSRDIVELAEKINGTDFHSRIHIRGMANAAIKMVTDSIESFVNKNLDLALSVMKYDDVVDEFFDRIKEELVAILKEDKAQSGEVCVDLLMVAKYLERIGDHAVNIAEWVEFSITGNHRKQ